MAQSLNNSRHILRSTVSYVHGLEVVEKRLSVLVHIAFPAFSIFKLIIYYHLNNPLCELISCDHPDVTEIQIREATESTELPTETHSQFFSIRRRTLIQIDTILELKLKKRATFHLCASDFIFEFKGTFLLFNFSR